MRKLLLIVALAAGLVACGDDHTGEHCTEQIPITTIVTIGGCTCYPMTTYVCSRWEKDT